MIENKVGVDSYFNYCPSLNTRNLPKILLKVAELVTVVVVSAGVLGRGPLAALIGDKLMTKVAVVIGTVFVCVASRIISRIYRETVKKEKLDKTKDLDKIERDENTWIDLISIHEERIKNNLNDLTYFHPTLHEDIGDQKLDILLKYKNVIGLSEKVVKKINEIITQKTELFEKTKDLKPLVSE